MYKPRLFLRYVVNNGTCHLSNGTAPSNKITINKALVVSKLSRYEVERYRQKQMTDREFEKHLKNIGSNYEKIIKAHEGHKSFESKVVHSLKSLGVTVRVVNRLSYNDECANWADIVIPTGGDGTFLLAASRVRNNVIPVVGLNSDTSRSEGYLCLPKKYSTDIDEALHRLLAGNFTWLLRNRIRVTMIGPSRDTAPTDLHEISSDMSVCWKVKERILPYLALNEVFIGETLSAKVSHLDVWLNDELQHTSVKSSGLCISTGTGSTSWHSSINRLSVHTVAELLRLLDMNPTEDEYSLATLLSNMYNKQLLFSPTHDEMAYTIRDLISASVWPKPKGIKPRSFAKKIKVQSRCYDASLVIDGGVSFAFNSCASVLLDIHPEDALRTTQFSD